MEINRNFIIIIKKKSDHNVVEFVKSKITFYKAILRSQLIV